jgi:histidine triad (HIT) family protein
MPATCAFCAIISGEATAVIIMETERVIAFLDHRPLFRGHTLLVPKLHVRLLSDLPADSVPEFFHTAQRLERAVEDGLGADGSMILVNNVVSQSVPHLHLHASPGTSETACVSGLARGTPTTTRTRPRPSRKRSGRRCLRGHRPRISFGCGPWRPGSMGSTPHGG